jgi:urocanate hydratase
MLLQARILYSDQVGRIAISERFNQAIAAGKIQGNVVISRDHHDVRYINPGNLQNRHFLKKSGKKSTVFCGPPSFLLRNIGGGIHPLK